MRFKPRLLQRWQFSVSVIAPAAAFLVLTAAVVLGFVIWTTRGVDERAMARETRLAATAVQRQIAEIPRAQESVAIWDDTIQNTRVTFNQEWLDNNLGVWMWEFYGFDAVAVIDESDRAIYTMAGGRSPSVGIFEANRPVLKSLIDQLRTELAAGALARYDAGEAAEFPRMLDIRRINGRQAVVSILPIVSQTGTIAQEPDSEYLHLAIDYLDADFAAQIEESYRFASAGFEEGAAPTDGLASYPVLDRAGRVATFFQWAPSRPGTDLLNQTGPALAVAFLAAAVLVAGLVQQLWKSSSTLEAERVDARRQAMHDALTGLPNRVQFESQLERMLKNQGAHAPTVSLLMLDLDRFKQVNDTLGHHAGDDLICAVGQRLNQLVGPGDVLARLGGDEFAIAHAGPEGRKGALALASRIIDAVSKPFDVTGSEAFVGASIGLAVAGRGDRDTRELTRKADIALYEAKSTGRNRVVAYQEAMNEQLQDRHMIEAELREALKRGDQLSVAFQPLYAASTGQIAGAEALVRWTHPRLGAIAPARFIPIAEGAGLIEALGEFVLTRACRFGARWPGLRMAVNISPAQLRNPRFPERVFDLMVENAMRPSDLELEITENILLDSGGAAGEALVAFRNAGIRIALDDFGTGYSSLNYLKRYPVDCIKIDRSFVAQLAPRNTSVAIVQAMVTLAHALDIEVTAEGVETHEQMTMLKTMGCNLFQGFLLSPPSPEEVVEQKFRRATERRGVVARIA
jgi:diguanylate cyclase (GGDEF)-like protein